MDATNLHAHTCILYQSILEVKQSLDKDLAPRYEPYLDHIFDAVECLKDRLDADRANGLIDVPYGVPSNILSFNKFFNLCRQNNSFCLYIFF